MSLEMCDICDQPTGGAGRLDDSLVCANCNKVICGGCQAEFDEIVICKPCAAKAFGIPIDRLEAICQAEREGRLEIRPTVAERAEAGQKIIERAIAKRAEAEAAQKGVG